MTYDEPEKGGEWWEPLVGLLLIVGICAQGVIDWVRDRFDRTRR